MIRTLLFSTLYPNSIRPSHGIFVETRLRHLLASGEVETRVIAPVPWFPFRHALFGEYAAYAAVPHVEVHNGIHVAHPRYLLLPRIGMNHAPHALARSGLAAAKRLIADGYDFDLIDAHYFYPDGVAATMIGKALGKPVIITARGTDINLIAQYAKPRQMILDAISDCAAIITVSVALKETVAGMSGMPEKITVMPNGVDLALFHPVEKKTARAKYHVDRYALACVGNMIPSKGHQRAIKALPQLPDVELLIAGRGKNEQEFQELAMSLGVSDRVRFLGVLSQAELCGLYSAADALVLASEREGWPNVLLEAMACGTPVIASRVGGVPEIITAPEAGVLLDDLDPACIVAAVGQLRRAGFDRQATRAHSELFRWDATTAGQTSLFKQVLGRH